MKKIYYLLLSGLILMSTDVIGQDIHFSQFYMSPLTLNPALTGVMNANSRFIGNYRNQWSPVIPGNAYNTYAVSYDQKMPVGRYDNFGFGVNLWADRAGSLDFQTVTGKLTGSYAKRVAGTRKKSHYVVAGAEFGLSQRSVSFINAQWPSQSDGNGGHAPEIDPGENFDNINNNFLFGDVGLGLLWFSVLGNNSNFYIGGSYKHLNQPNISFFNDNVVQYFSKSVIHGGGEFPLNDKVSLVPGAVAFFQGPSMEINAGTSFRFAMGSRFDAQSFQLGVWFRMANHFDENTPLTADALILSTRFDFGGFGIGFSYDVNVSSLKQASNSNGSFEFSMIYTISGPQSRGVYCPKF